MVFKIINGLIDLDFSSFFTYGQSYTRGHNFKLSVPAVRLNSRAHFFSVRVVPVWNVLPFDVVNARTLSSFRAKLDKFDLSVFV